MPDLGLMDRINRYLIDRDPCPLTFGDRIDEDFFPGESEQEVMCRHDPSPVVIKRYMNGTKQRAFNFSYYAASTNVVAARQQLEAFQEVLFLDDLSDLLGLSQGRLVPVTAPSPVSKDEHGRVIYTSAYRLEFYEEGA